MLIFCVLGLGLFFSYSTFYYLELYNVFQMNVPYTCVGLPWTSCILYRSWLVVTSCLAYSLVFLVAGKVNLHFIIFYIFGMILNRLVPLLHINSHNLFSFFIFVVFPLVCPSPLTPSNHLYPSCPSLGSNKLSLVATAFVWLLNINEVQVFSKELH